jgi:hypothetical protein
LLACSRMFFEGAHTFFQQHFTLLFPMSHKCNRLIICTRVCPDSVTSVVVVFRLKCVCLLYVSHSKKRCRKHPLRKSPPALSNRTVGGSVTVQPEFLGFYLFW